MGIGFSLGYAERLQASTKYWLNFEGTEHAFKRYQQRTVKR